MDKESTSSPIIGNFKEVADQFPELSSHCFSLDNSEDLYIRLSKLQELKSDTLKYQVQCIKLVKAIGAVYKVNLYIYKHNKVNPITFSEGLIRLKEGLSKAKETENYSYIKQYEELGII